MDDFELCLDTIGTVEITIAELTGGPFIPPPPTAERLTQVAKQTRELYDKMLPALARLEANPSTILPDQLRFFQEGRVRVLKMIEDVEAKAKRAHPSAHDADPLEEFGEVTTG